MTATSFPSEWLRGVLEICVLKVIADGPTYGYAITEVLAKSGFGAVKGGTLYPLLSRLEQSGLVEVEWRAGEGGPGRKYYRITREGLRTQRASAASWRRFAQTATDFLDRPLP
ncbi:MAG: PadR family transcriptional regulator [Propionibacteriaceae bacterium]|nr:PadR family transcriptional regulator [Propionibacteriaceae bacterium]